MRNRIAIASSLIVMLSCILYSCTKDQGINPELAFNDRALYDSCRNLSAFTYYKNDPAAVYSGVHGPHGAFKLRFNRTAYAALTDNGKIPVNKKFPDGSMIVKDVQSSGQFVIMYKKTGTWLWAEINADGSVAFSTTKEPTATCISCHSQSGQRDLAVSFNFY
jgi:hypothetical protein